MGGQQRRRDSSWRTSRPTRSVECAAEGGDGAARVPLRGDRSSSWLFTGLLLLIYNGAMTIENAFDASVDYYDDWMMKALPNYHDIFHTAQELVFFDPAKPIDVIDLGAGTGLFSKHIFDRFPKANFLLYDLAQKMLEVAKERFVAFPQQFSYFVGDYRNIDASRSFDLAISSLSIHHLADADKRLLFQAVYQLLKKPGLLINIDQIKGTTTYLRQLYWDHWLAQVREKGQSGARIQESVERRKYDRDASLADQLAWLSEAGFSNVDCVYKNFFVGVFLAVKE